MKIGYVPLLPIQRELQALPRNYDRFRQYLRTIFSWDKQFVERPALLIANPMAKDHVTALLDALLAMDADGLAVRTIAEVTDELTDEPGDFRAALVVADDLMGGWTNRYATEFTFRFQAGPPAPADMKLPRWVKHFWISMLLWSSEAATEQVVRETVLMAIHRAAYIQRHGPARTLRDMLRQEGYVMAKAGCTKPVLEEDDIAYTREVLVPYLDADDMRTAIECLFGDAPGRTLGFTPRGLSPWAGLALALHDAQASLSLQPDTSPVACA
jgi:hypothetical protein